MNLSIKSSSKAGGRNLSLKDNLAEARLLLEKVLNFSP